MKLLSSFFFIVLLALQANAQSLQRVAPEQVGMDSRHLLYADEAIETAIAKRHSRCRTRCSTQREDGLPQSIRQQACVP